MSMIPYSTHQRAKQHGVAFTTQQAHVSSALLALSRGSNNNKSKLCTLETHAFPNTQDEENATNRQVTMVPPYNTGFKHQEEPIFAKPRRRPSIMPNQILKSIPHVSNQYAHASNALLEMSQSKVNVNVDETDGGGAPGSKRPREVPPQTTSTASNVHGNKDTIDLTSSPPPNGNEYTTTTIAKHDSSQPRKNISLSRHPTVKTSNRSATTEVVAPPPIMPPCCAPNAPRTMHSSQSHHGARTMHSNQAHSGARAMHSSQSHQGVRTMHSNQAAPSDSSLQTNVSSQPNEPPLYQHPTKHSLWAYASQQTMSSPAWTYGWSHGWFPTYGPNGTLVLDNRNKDQDLTAIAPTIQGPATSRNKRKPHWYDYDPEFQPAAMDTSSVDGDSTLGSDVESTPIVETARRYPRRGKRRLVKNNSSESLIDNDSRIHLEEYIQPNTDNTLTKGNVALSNYHPTSRDVLMGRGGDVNHHEGNKAFRSIVSRHQPQYLATKRHTDKSRIALRIVSIIQDNGGMFLAKNTGTGEWEQVSNEKAKEKTNHALREGQAVRRNQNKSNESSATGDEPSSKRQKFGKEESVPSLKESSATTEEERKDVQDDDKAISPESESHQWDDLLELLPATTSSEIAAKDNDKAIDLDSDSSSEIPAKDDGDWNLDSDFESDSMSPMPTPPAETGGRYPRRGNRGVVKNNSSKLLIDNTSPVLCEENIRATSVGADAKPKTNRNSTEADANIPPSNYEPTSHDVLVERCRGNSSHEGNKAFRSIVSRHEAEYHAAKNRGDKSRIARRIVGIIQNNGGMFIAKNPATGEWEQVSNEKATQKTLQAIWREHRQNKNPRRKRDSSATDDDEPSSKRQKVDSDELVPSLKESHSDNQCLPDKTSSEISAKDNDKVVVAEPRIFNDKWAALMKRYPERDPKNKNARFPRRYRTKRSLYVPS